jgi:hypothetical protein
VNTGWPFVGGQREVAEEVILERVLTDPAFAAYYAARRAGLGVIRWLQCELPARVGGVSTAFRDGSMQIALPEAPASVGSGHIVAHEMEHHVLFLEGFPATSGLVPHAEKLSTLVNSLFEDPLVEARLAGFGLDALRDYEALWKQSWDDLASRPQEEPRATDGWYSDWVLNHATTLVVGRILYTGKDKERNAFAAWFTASFPHIAAVSEEVVRIMDEIGYGTPESALVAMPRVVDHLGLVGVLQVDDRRGLGLDTQGTWTETFS